MASKNQTKFDDIDKRTSRSRYIPTTHYYTHPINDTNYQVNVKASNSYKNEHLYDPRNNKKQAQNTKTNDEKYDSISIGVKNLSFKKDEVDHDLKQAQNEIRQLQNEYEQLSEIYSSAKQEILSAKQEIKSKKKKIQSNYEENVLLGDTIRRLKSEKLDLKDTIINQRTTYTNQYGKLRNEHAATLSNSNQHKILFDSLYNYAQTQEQKLQSVQQIFQSAHGQFQKQQQKHDFETKQKYDVSEKRANKAAQSLLNVVNKDYNCLSFSTDTIPPPTGKWVHLQKYKYQHRQQLQPQQPYNRQPHLFINGVDRRYKLTDPNFCRKIVKLHCTKFNGKNGVATGMLLSIKRDKIYVLTNAHNVMDRICGNYNYSITGEWKIDGITTNFTFDITHVIVHPKHKVNGFDLAVVTGTLGNNVYSQLSNHGLGDTQLFDVCLVDDLGSKMEGKDIALFGYDGAKSDVYGHHSKGTTIQGEEIRTRFIDSDYGQSGGPFVVYDCGSNKRLFAIGLFWAGDDTDNFTQNFGIKFTSDKIEWVLQCCEADVVFKISTGSGLSFYTFCV